VGILTSAQQSKDEELDLTAPAFNVTKVGSGVGVLIAAVIAVVPPALKDDEAVIVASIAVAALVILGAIALAAVDVMTRQRAREATLRYGTGKAPEQPLFYATPVENDLILQRGHSKDEYEVKLALVEKDRVSLVASRNGETIAADFAEAPSSK
jgi:hypothetical protein